MAKQSVPRTRACARQSISSRKPVVRHPFRSQNLENGVTFVRRWHMPVYFRSKKKQGAVLQLGRGARAASPPRESRQNYKAIDALQTLLLFILRDVCAWMNFLCDLPRIALSILTCISARNTMNCVEQPSSPDLGRSEAFPCQHRSPIQHPLPNQHPPPIQGVAPKARRQGAPEALRQWP